MSMNVYNITYAVRTAERGTTATGSIIMIRAFPNCSRWIRAQLQGFIPGVDFEVEEKSDTAIDARGQPYHDAGLVVRDHVTKVMQQAGHLEDPKLKELEGRRAQLQKIRDLMDADRAVDAVIGMTGKELEKYLQERGGMLLEAGMGGLGARLHVLSRRVIRLQVSPKAVVKELDTVRSEVRLEEQRMVWMIEENKSQKKGQP
jgi:uncharacterized protein (UPF0261 family)